MKNTDLKQKGAIKSRNSIRGFTLIELMVVVMIIAVLAAIAIPSYRSFILRNAQSDTQAIMQNRAIKLKQWRAKKLNYDDYCMVIDPDDKEKCLSNTILVPEGSTSSDYRYKITLVDGTKTDKALTDTDISVTGQSWSMLAEPNPSGMFKYGNTYLMKSDGRRCYVTHTGTLANSDDCTGSGVETW